MCHDTDRPIRASPTKKENFKWADVLFIVASAPLPKANFKWADVLFTGGKYMEYRICNKEDFLQLRSLWKICFNDSNDFIDYYFNEVCSRNVIFAAFDGEKLVSMAHLNPYTIVFNGRRKDVHYIVGVGTLPEYRKKGIMRELMMHVIEWIKNGGEDFTYLMPEDNRYYESQGFFRLEESHIYDAYALAARYEDRYEDMDMIHYSDVSDYLWKDFNSRIAETYDVFTMRNSEYISGLDLCCQSEGGEVLVVTKSDRIIAIAGFMNGDKGEEIIQYITTEKDLESLGYMIHTLSNPADEIELFGRSISDEDLILRPGKGIMFNIINDDFKEKIMADNMLINEIV